MLHDSSSFIICCVIPPKFPIAQIDAPRWLLSKMEKSYTMHILLCKQQDLMTSWNLGSIVQGSQSFTPKANYCAKCCNKPQAQGQVVNWNFQQVQDTLKSRTSTKYIMIQDMLLVIKSLIKYHFLNLWNLSLPNLHIEHSSINLSKTHPTNGPLKKKLFVLYKWWLL